MPNEYMRGVNDAVKVLYKRHYDLLSLSYQHPDEINLKNNQALRLEARMVLQSIEELICEIHTNRGWEKEPEEAGE